MATIRRFEELEAWKLAHVLYMKTSQLIDQGSFKKNFRLINQVEGSLGSIMDNIAEGFERGTRGEFIQFLGYAKGSCGEFRSQLYRALNRKYVGNEEYKDLFFIAVRISAMIQKLIEYLQRTNIEGIRKKRS